MPPQKIPAYSSLAAFLAHYRALKSSAGYSEDKNRLLAAMETAIGALSPEERAALESGAADGTARRHRERAELKLSRELAARGMLAG
jgi:hypothetical protein